MSDLSETPDSAPCCVALCLGWRTMTGFFVGMVILIVATLVLGQLIAWLASYDGLVDD